jgi:hypothetical protein
MGVVAVDTVIPLPRPPRKIPVPGHSTMAAVLVVAVLRTMALGTKSHRLFPGDRGAVRQMQGCIVVIDVVTSDTGQLPMLKL